MSSVCKKLIIANVVVFVLQITITTQPEDLRQFGEFVRGAPRISVIEEWCGLDPYATIRGQIWRPLTYAFCHSRDNLLHLVFNMLFLWWFGTTLEHMFGSREFLKFYLTAAVVSGIVFVVIALVLGDRSPAIGASGAIMAIMMVFAMYFPRQQVLLMGIIPIEIRWLVAAYVIFDSFPILSALSGRGVHDGIAHAAHLGGLAFGFVYKRYGLNLDSYFRGGTFSRWKTRLQRRNVRLYDPPSEVPREKPPAATNFELEVDRILAKIHEQGEESLTEKERKVLKDASQKYRNRSL